MLSVQKIETIENTIDVYESLLRNKEFIDLKKNNPEKFAEEMVNIFPTFSKNNEFMFKIMIRENNTRHIKNILNIFKKGLIDKVDNEILQKNVYYYMFNNGLS